MLADVFSIIISETKLPNLINYFFRKIKKLKDIKKTPKKRFEIRTFQRTLFFC